MSAAIVAALKKIAVAIIGNPKVLKKIGGILLGVIVIIIMPILAVLGIFSGDIEIDTVRLQTMIEESMTEEEIGRLQLIGDVMLKIEEEMTTAGYSADRINEAQVLYSLSLTEFSGEEDFVDRLVGCFQQEQTDEELILSVNETFGTQINAEEFIRVMDGIRTDTEQV